MFTTLTMIALCLVVAVYGAWNTAHTRHTHALEHKRRHSDR